jgi:hypothetical protein
MLIKRGYEGSGKIISNHRARKARIGQGGPAGGDRPKDAPGGPLAGAPEGRQKRGNKRLKPPKRPKDRRRLGCLGVMATLAAGRLEGVDSPFRARSSAPAIGGPLPGPRAGIEGQSSARLGRKRAEPQAGATPPKGGAAPSRRRPSRVPAGGQERKAGHLSRVRRGAYRRHRADGSVGSRGDGRRRDAHHGYARRGAAPPHSLKSWRLAPGASPGPGPSPPSKEGGVGRWMGWREDLPPEGGFPGPLREGPGSWGGRGPPTLARSSFGRSGLRAPASGALNPGGRGARRTP